MSSLKSFFLMILNDFNAVEWIQIHSMLTKHWNRRENWNERWNFELVMIWLVLGGIALHTSKWLFLNRSSSGATNFQDFSSLTNQEGQIKSLFLFGSDENKRSTNKWLNVFYFKWKWKNIFYNQFITLILMNIIRFSSRKNM